ncbi:MAG TPA: putative Ig domain-containing protein, partial [Burkholderiales bacterium]|nr:putative Ig domain-containing protein [Burkholderiales bacterium]
MSRILYNGPLASRIHAAEGPSGVVMDWSGGTLDTKRDRLVIWGGGHNGYAGNEVYAFDLRTLRWERLSNPSSIAGYDRKSGEYPDGTPASTHTYDALTYLPDPYDGLFVSMLPSIYQTGTGSLVSWFFDFKKNEWKKLGRAVNGNYGNSMTVYDPVTGHVWEQGGVFNGQVLILEYDPEKNVWSKRNNGSDTLPYFVQTAAIDPLDHLFVAVGGGYGLLLHGQTNRIALDVWNLNRPGNAKTPVRSGPLDVENSNSPGFVWYPPGKVFVGWPNGGASVYSLDPKNWRWEMHPPAADNRVVPPHTSASGGTFGRFQYVPSMGVFVLVNGPGQNVYLYKPDFGAGRPFASRNCVLPVMKNTESMKMGLGIPIKLGISASNNPTSYYAGGLPPGLSFDARTGIISGAPSVQGKFDMTVGAYSRCGTGKPETISASVEAKTPFELASNGRRYPTLQKAADAAMINDRIEVDPGTYANYLVYAQIRKPLTIEGKGGMASFVSTIPIPNRKGMIISDVPNGKALKIDNLELSGAFIGSGDGANGAAIRLETGNLVVTNSYIHDNQNGILAGDDRTSMAKISNSVIEHNGLGRQGFTHGVYFSHVAEVDIDHSTFGNDTYGHHIKSRAAKTAVSNSLID